MKAEKINESRGILKAALQNEPTHPGALHYLIHAYDVEIVDIAEQARKYTLSYKRVYFVCSWNLALSDDGIGIIVSFVLCATKLLHRNVSISSTDLNSVLTLLNAIQIPSLLKYDAENRAYSIEWFAYSHLQTANWQASIGLLRDLFIAENQPILTPNHYLPLAYRTQTRTIVELFFWFSYNDRF